MSTLKAEIVEIKTVAKHPNADRLDIITMNSYDWVVVTGKDNYRPGDKAIYIPIDSVLPEKLECYLFPPDSKIKLEKSRVKTIKIRQCVSQGMVVDISPELIALFPHLKTVNLGDDVTSVLGIQKYEPPISIGPGGTPKTSKRHVNPLFDQYTDIENFKYYPDAFEGEEVYVTEKLHGTSSRYALLPRQPRGLLEGCRQRTRWFLESVLGLEKAKSFIILDLLEIIWPRYEYCFGSKRVQLQDKGANWTGFYDHNVYALIGEKYAIADKLRPGETLYGEIIGIGLQGSYTYGHTQENPFSFYAYDVKRDGRYLDYNEFITFCIERGFSPVPHLFTGQYNRDMSDTLRRGKSTLNQPIKEGIVIKPVKETIEPRFGRKVLKWINDDYLLQSDVTDNH